MMNVMIMMIARLHQDASPDRHSPLQLSWIDNGDYNDDFADGGDNDDVVFLSPDRHSPLYS